MRTRLTQATSLEQACRSMRDEWAKCNRAGQEVQMKMKLKELTRDMELSLSKERSMIENLGYANHKATKPTKAPGGSAMLDNLFVEKPHKCHEIRKKMDKSGIFEKTVKI